MEQSSWEVNNFSTSKNIFCMLWNQNIHHCIHKSPPVVPFLSHIYPVHTLSSCSYKMHCNISLPSKPRSSEWFLSFRFYNQSSVCISLLPILATCLAHPILLEFITWIIFGEGHRFTLFWHILSLYGSLKREVWFVNCWFRSYKILGLLRCFSLSSVLKIFEILKVNTKFQKLEVFLPTGKKVSRLQQSMTP
jgi:hypothetical protein